MNVEGESSKSTFRKRKASVLSSTVDTYSDPLRSQGATEIDSQTLPFSTQSIQDATPIIKTEPSSSSIPRSSNTDHVKEHQPEVVLKRITVPFFRYFGPTANTPGYRRVKVRTLTLSEATPQTPTSSSPEDTTTNPDGSGDGGTMGMSYQSYGQPFMSSIAGPHMTNGKYAGRNPVLNPGHEIFTAPDSRYASLFDSQRPRYPSPIHLPHLTGLFFDHLACHFPFLDRREVMKAVEDETLPAVLANALAALACRFSDRPELVKGKRHLSGEAYNDMAKLLIVHMLSWPSLEVVQALILIAWSEFGGGRDSGLWMYSRMAVAMAMDHGIHSEETLKQAPEADREKMRLTWWAVLLIDRINSWGTGRPIAIADTQFDTALPSIETDTDVTKPPPPGLVFGHLASLVMLRGKLGDVLNNMVKRKNPGAELELTQLQWDLTTWYQCLPPTMVFNLQNFRRFATHNQSACFLLLHCMFHSVITVLHRPSLLQSFTPNVALPIGNSVEVSRSSARSLVDMISFADEMDPNSLIANPFLDLPILTAARSFLAEREFLNTPPEAMSLMAVTLMRQWSETSLESCKDALKKMSKYWGGVGCVKMILDQQSTGDMDFDVGDSHVAYIRDVELITQWATKSWRRKTGSGARSPVKLDPSQYSQPSVIPVNSIATPTSSVSYSLMGANGVPGSGASLQDSPDGASVGITGFLDGLLGGGGSTDENSGNPTLRVSFNPAEADLSFPHLSATELFNIPETFEEFLGSALDFGALSSFVGMGSLGGNGGTTPHQQLPNGDQPLPPQGSVHQIEHQPTTDRVPLPAIGQREGEASPEVQHLPHSILPEGNGSDVHNMFPIPAFSTLIGPWFPMGQFSRASSPVPNAK